MKSLKKPLRKLLHDQGNLHERVNKLRRELDEVQKALYSNPTDHILCNEERDSNSAYFHKLVKSQNQRSRIEVILSVDNVDFIGSHVPDVFVSHYEMFLRNSLTCNAINDEGLFDKKSSNDTSINMVRYVTDSEIKPDMFAIGDDRALGPDGFSSAFFKKSWDIVGKDDSTKDKGIQTVTVNSDVFWSDSNVTNANVSGSSSVTKEQDASKPINSFAAVLQDQPLKKVFKIKEMRSEENVEGAAVTLPFEAFEAVNARFINTLVGYFIGERRMLNEWTPNTILKKDEIKCAPVWVKLHHVPIVAYSEIGLSLITSALIEISSLTELKKSLVIAIPLANKKGHTLATIDVEYEWTPPRCNTCRIFDHVSEKCPMLPKETTTPKASEEGFTEVKRKKNKKHPAKKKVEGIRLSKSNLNLQYRRVEPKTINAKTDGKKDRNQHIQSDVNLSSVGTATTSKQDTNGLKLKNSYSYLDGNESDWDIDDTKLSVHYRFRDRPWCILGDFNAALFLHDYSVGNSRIDISMREFKECVEDLEVMDVQHSGLQYTWTQKPKGNEGLLKKIDRVMANLMFNDVFAGNLHNNVNQLRNDLDQVQIRLDADPFNESIREEEAMVLAAFNDACLMEEKFLKQKAKIDWLREGDSNSAYFHKLVKSRTSRSRIELSADLRSLMVGFSINDQVAGGTRYAFVYATTSFYIEDVALNMTGHVTRQEVKSALFSMGNDKAPGPDGYTVAFFKESWDIVADDFVDAVCEFFTNGKLLRELNHTIITLIPKVSNPTRVTDYRPISCCNVMFKCISKIIVNRIKESLKTLVSLNQSAFVPGRSIADNILLTQELMHNYHLDRGVPSINGSLHGFFKGKRGLRQGDPLSPYLFTLVMEILTLMLQRGVSNANMFSYHRYCSKLKLINLCFADDLFLFSHGDMDSVKVIKEALNEFKEAPGLILPFKEGYLPVKYLGVPLVTSRLVFRDCKELIENVHARVDDWKNKFLSAAGRLQLIRSVLSSMHIYWASMFILPSRVLLDIEQIIRRFLWSHGSMKKGRAKVAWDVVCLPKDEGGLGVRRLDTFNKALMVSHMWNFLSSKESLWVKWVHVYKLKGRNFWELPIRGRLSWGWRKVLQLRPLIRDYIGFSISDGDKASLWFDNWSTLGPLADFISSRDRHVAGLNASSKVCDVFHDGQGFFRLNGLGYNKT
ncbi:hypothetical protein Tco_0822596 [Tanacetum coccineum]|uniref:Reverse transcriptase domain-containing protein n=1 Tax=Tanacetum coccineum TaxID=301880 RepID=A0ABQ5AI50_9ASTR